MHELSIAMSIVDIAEKQVREHGASHVEQIDLEIGTLAGIEMESLNFAWPMAVKGTVLEHARRVIHTVQARAICPDCQTEFEAESLFTECPTCANFMTSLLQGQELRVKSLTLMQLEDKVASTQPPP